MEKIIVMTSGSDNDSNLIECLKALFPECEIDIQKRMPKNNASIELVSEDTAEPEVNEDLEKYLSFL